MEYEQLQEMNMQAKQYLLLFQMINKRWSCVCPVFLSTVCFLAEGSHEGLTKQRGISKQG